MPLAVALFIASRMLSGVLAGVHPSPASAIIFIMATTFGSNRHALTSWAP